MGRVASKKAGAASMAVAMPALIAYFMSLSPSLSPIDHKLCFARPIKVSLLRGGVCMVLGACGRTFGKEGCVCRSRLSLIIYAAINVVKRSIANESNQIEDMMTYREFFSIQAFSFFFCHLCSRCLNVQDPTICVASL